MFHDDASRFCTHMDALAERAAELALSPRWDGPGLVAALGREHPQATMLELAAAIAAAATALEEVGEGRASGRLHRLAALAALDAWMAERRGWPNARIGELSLYRRLHGHPVVELS